MIAVSVVVPTYNRLEILRETVGRLLRQDLGSEEYEVVVVDDHSSDGTGAWLEEAGREPRLRWLRSPRRGRSSARNAGVAAARGEMVCFLDDDMWVGPGCLWAHWEAYLAAGPAATVGVGRMRPYPGNAPTLANRAYDRRLAHIDDCMAQYGEDLPCRYLCTGNVSLPRRLFTAGLSFDESFAGYSFEDTELGYRLAGQGVRFRYLPEAYAEHRTDTTVAALLRKREEAGRSAVHFLQRHPEAAEHLEVPFAVPGVATTRRRDGRGKRLVKAAAFSRLASWVLEALVPVAGGRVLEWAGYARYGRAFRGSVGGAHPPAPLPRREGGSEGSLTPCPLSLQERGKEREALSPPSLGLRLVGRGLGAVNRLGGRGGGAGAAPRKILVVRRGYVGDVIETTALLGDLRRAYPGAEIVYMTGPGGAQVLAGNRNVDRVTPYLELPGGGAGGWRALRRLRRERFDLGLCLSHNSRDALLLRLAGVARAAGFAEPQREFLLEVAVTWDERELRAGQERYEELLRALGIEPAYRAYDFPAAAEAGAAAVSRLLPGWDPAARPLLVLAPGGGRHPAGAAPYRQWAPERFAAVVGLVDTAGQAEVALVGDHEDRAVAQQVVAALPAEARGRVQDLTGQTSLAEMGALLSRAGVLIANDSAPVWIAAAVGCPVVSIFGCNHPANHRPLVAAYAAIHGETPCHPCFSGARAPDCPLPARCLEQIEAAQVAAAARQVAAEETAERAARPR